MNGMVRYLTAMIARFAACGLNTRLAPHLGTPASQSPMTSDQSLTGNWVLVIDDWRLSLSTRTLRIASRQPGA